MERGAVEEWDARLGWMGALVSDDEIAHRRALDHYLRVARETREARAAYDTVVLRVPRSVSAEETAWQRFRAAWLRTPAAALLAEPLAAAEVPDWGGLPYALTYLEWEARYPTEWTRHAKVWSTKQRLIRLLAVPGHHAEARSRLVDLVEAVVYRRHRCKDREYSRIARVVDGEDLRARLTKAQDSGEPWTRDQAGHVLWLLHNPQIPINRTNWFRWLSINQDTPQPPPGTSPTEPTAPTARPELSEAAEPPAPPDLPDPPNPPDHPNPPNHPDPPPPPLV
ncbi:hypothetical protein [Embleya sp. NPDC059259]|uniref:hypothetical protein n=1 Tax=unclassified Embleya TaxID=2699296 RepID=UPI0036C9B4E5